MEQNKSISIQEFYSAPTLLHEGLCHTAESLWDLAMREHNYTTLQMTVDGHNCTVLQKNPLGKSTVRSARSFLIIESDDPTYVGLVFTNDRKNGVVDPDAWYARSLNTSVFAQVISLYGAIRV